MIVHYVDPSAWVKRHFQETGSEAMNALFRTSINAACSRVGIIEMVATVARKSAQDSLTSAQTSGVLDNIRADFAAFRVVLFDEPIASTAEVFAVRHRLRTMDALHLSSALSLQPLGEIIMVSADSELLAASAREGLTTMNPATTAG